MKECLRRRKELDEEIQIDWGRIEELKLQNVKSNNKVKKKKENKALISKFDNYNILMPFFSLFFSLKRDAELDILNKKNEKNKKKLETMSKILLKEINSYKKQADFELDEIFKNLARIQLKLIQIN